MQAAGRILCSRSIRFLHCMAERVSIPRCDSSLSSLGLCSNSLISGDPRPLARRRSNASADDETRIVHSRSAFSLRLDDSLSVAHCRFCCLPGLLPICELWGIGNRGQRPMANRLCKYRIDRHSLPQSSNGPAKNYPHAGGPTWFAFCNYGKNHAPWPHRIVGLRSAFLYGWDFRRVFVPRICLHGVCPCVCQLWSAKFAGGNFFFCLVFPGPYLSGSAWGNNYIYSRYDFLRGAHLDWKPYSGGCYTYWHRFGNRHLFVDASWEIITTCPSTWKLI